jgi:ABC-type multidrug transport system fused ATPase/permease subunit
VLGPDLLPSWSRKVGYVPQSIYLCDASIAENVALGIAEDEIDEQAVMEAARAAHLEDFIASLPDGPNTLVGERGIRLSGGERQRIGIARALYHQPELLVLDEATSALDNVTEDVVMQAIRDLSHRRTILIIAHRLSSVRDADVIHLLEDGRVVDRGTYEELVQSSATFRAMARV